MSYLKYIGILTVILAGCKHDLKQISSEGTTAESVYLTHDNKNNPVIVWTENEDDNLVLFFAISRDNGKTFSADTRLPLTPDVATHSESVPKIAFKKNGTIIAAYEKKVPTNENKYAGAIYYVASSDGGKSWSKETFLHSDTIAGRSRSYFDIEQLPDGEIGASWLDIKLNNETGGRSVRFARTSSANDFGDEILIDSSACQCCRIDVYSDLTGRVNIAYRGLMKNRMGKDIRDMMITTSNDNGKNFTTPTRISQDDWVIDGCPHTGPSLCSSKESLYSMWFTEGNGTGIYYNFRQHTDTTFSQRQLVSNSGRHPQLSVNNDRFIMVWEENNKEDHKRTAIRYQLSDGETVTKDYLTPEIINAFSPVVMQTGDGFLVAFLMETEDRVSMFVTKL
jgi:hypothetical protein